MKRRIQVGVIGSNDVASSPGQEEFAARLGKALVEEGYRIVCGGCGGVMEAVCRGARMSESYHNGDTIGILPSIDGTEANDFVDVSIATGVGYARNQIIVASSDVIVAIGGGAGTLSEIALGWQLGKGIIAVDLEEGWSSKMAGMRLDSRIERPIAYARSIDDVIFHIGERLPSISSSPIPSETVIDGRFIVRDRFRVMANREHYRLRDHKHNVNYAMKTHVRTSERDWKQFESEIQMVKSLSHQSIPTIISDGQLDVGGVSRRYMVTEWHPVSLSEVKVMEMETPSLMELYGRILDTCCYLEEKRILHRDLKPGNILINEKTCHPILNDFYRFQAFDDQTTYEYNNKREDMFNMGKLLLYLITGRYDFKPTHIDDLSRHRGGDDYDMGSIRALIRGMVDPEPDCRPSSFAKVRGELAGMTGAMK